MEPLTAAEIDRINDIYWSGRDPACPRCGATLGVAESDELHNGPAELLVTCPGCGLSDQIQGAAEGGGEMTQAQMADMIRGHLRGQRPVCPADGTALRVERIDGPLDGTKTAPYTLTCPRCHAHGDIAWNPDIHGAEE